MTQENNLEKIKSAIISKSASDAYIILGGISFTIMIIGIFLNINIFIFGYMSMSFFAIICVLRDLISENLSSSVEYKKGYNDYPNENIYKKCKNIGKFERTDEIKRYMNGWKSAKQDDIHHNINSKE